MGNIHSGVSNYVERLPLDDWSEIVLRKTKNHKWREVVDTWIAEYSVGRSSCELNLTKTKRTQHEEELSIIIKDLSPLHSNDDVFFQFDVRVSDGLLLGNITLDGPRSMQQLPKFKTPIPQGGIFKSSSFLYGRDTDRKGLIVLLREKTIDDDDVLPYMITVMHYFVTASSSQGFFSVAKIRSDSNNGALIVHLEKPVTKSKRYILSMFDDVRGKGWKLNLTSIANHNNYAEGDILSGIRNNGNVHGNYNGSVIVNNYRVTSLDQHLAHQWT